MRAKERSGGTIIDVVAACDDEKLLHVARGAGASAVLTGGHHQCGTTRIAEAVERLGLETRADYVINVQGDEPELDPLAILEVERTLLESSWARMGTLVIAMPSTSADAQAKKANPNIVKAVLDGQGRAIYFSRAPVPFDRVTPTDGRPGWYHHLGIYAYRMDFLLEFASMPASGLEMQESLEQLRAIEAGHAIAARAIPERWAGKGIDTAEDYQAFVDRQTRRAA